jgi:hypothetical protein
MSITAGPNVVSSGLVLCLDAANPRSYPGSGTIWYDDSGNSNTGILTNGPTYNTANNGSLVFDGVDDYVSGTATPTNIKNLQAFSVFVWCKSTSASPSRRYVYDGRGNKAAAQKNSGVGMGFDSGYSDNKIFNFMSGADGTYTEASSPTTFLNNQIYQLGIVRDANSATFQVTDTDSTTLITPSFSAPRMTASTTVDLGEYCVGTYASSTPGGNYWWVGNVYLVLGYNRALSQLEVTQNFNALRGRYGI